MGGRSRQKKKKAERFYQAGANSLVDLGVTDARGGYACPQCLTVFSPQALLTHDLTLEHVPPRSLGGKEITLTCVRCNPRSGSQLEAALAKERRLEDFARGATGKWRANLVTVDDAAVPVTIVRGIDQRLSITGHSELCHPEKHRATFDYFDRQAGQTGWRFKLRLPAYDPREAMLGHLRVAFLAAFAKLGYSFLLNPLGRRLRDLIQNPDTTADLPTFFGSLTDPVDPSMRALVICESPFSCLTVQMGHRLVVLPWPLSGVDPYESLKATPLVSTTMSGQAMEWPTGMELVLDKWKIEQNAKDTDGPEKG
jgi:5-methylcytosine-specific restriction endonuclease McrA